MIDLPPAKQVEGPAGSVAVECTECHHTPAHCYCSSTGISRAELDRIAIDILFDRIQSLPMLRREIYRGVAQAIERRVEKLQRIGATLLEKADE